VSVCQHCGMRIDTCPGGLSCMKLAHDALRKRVDTLCECIATLIAEVERLEAKKCSHVVDKWGDSCENCNDSIVKDPR
jgi:hypothetical protein